MGVITATRKNLIANPSFEYDTLNGPPTEWSRSGGSSSDTQVVDTYSKFGGRSLWVHGDKLDPGPTDIILLTAVGAATPGQDYTASLYRYLPSDITGWVNCYLDFYDSSETRLSTHQFASSSSATDGFERVHLTETAPAGTATAHFLIGSWQQKSTENVYFDGIMLEESADLGNYFDGDTPDSGAVAYTWDATPGASSSTQTKTIIPVTYPVGPIVVPQRARLRATAARDGVVVTRAVAAPLSSLIARVAAPYHALALVPSSSRCTVLSTTDYHASATIATKVRTYLAEAPDLAAAGAIGLGFSARALLAPTPSILQPA